MKRWTQIYISVFIIITISLGLLTIVIDPFFHYHKPIAGLAYTIDNERYQNDGMLRNFDYDALIIGTSMTQNFKTSEFNELFGVRSIKTPFSGASTKEIQQNLNRAFKYNTNIKIVLWGLDYSLFYENYQNMKYSEYPTYLYDDNFLNDVNYFFNKSVLLDNTYIGVIKNTICGKTTTTFDEYRNWNAKYEFGKESVLTSIDRSEKLDEIPIRPLDATNLEVNILDVINNHPDVEFYLFWTPYSIVYFDDLNQRGQLKLKLGWELEALKKLLPCNNVHFFSFNDCFDIVTNLDNYKDYLHYSEDINSYILESMAIGEHKLNTENYQDYYDRIYKFYVSYDYDMIWK